MNGLSENHFEGIIKLKDGTVLQGKFEQSRFVEGIAFIPCENGSYVFKGCFVKDAFLGEKKSPNGDYSFGIFKSSQHFATNEIRQCFENLVLHGRDCASMQDGLLLFGTFISDKFVSGTMTLPDSNTCFSGCMTNFGFIGTKSVLNHEFSLGTFKSSPSPVLSQAAGIKEFAENLVLDGDNCYQHVLNQSLHAGKFINGVYIV